MATFRIRKRPAGGFTVIGTLSDGSNLGAREVREVTDLDKAAAAVQEIAEGFAARRQSLRGPAS